MVEDACQPRRVQLSRRAGWRKPIDAVVVARPTRWGNPWRVERLPVRGWSTLLAESFFVGRSYHHSESTARAFAVDRFRLHLAAPGSLIVTYNEVDVRAALAGRDLCCWCPLVDADGRPVLCHADVLLAVANPGLVLPAA